MGCPIVGILSAHVNDGKVRVDLSGVSCDVPPIEISRREIDVRDKRSVFAFGGIKPLDGILAGRSDDSREPAFPQAVFDHVLNKLVVFHDQDKQLVFHSATPGYAVQQRQGYTRELRVSFRGKYAKVLINKRTTPP